MASERLGVVVEIGRIEVHAGRWVPALTLHDVVLRDPQGSEALRLPQVATTLSARSLLSWRPRLAQVLIEGPQLEVRRDADGRLWIAGLDLSAETPTAAGSGVPDWLWDIGEFVIRRGSVRWTDALRGAPPLALTDVQLVVRNAGRRHDLRLDATPPADWGARLQIMVQARRPLLAAGALGGPEDWREWSASIYADLPQVDLARLRQQVRLPVDLRSGRAALRAWLDWDQRRPRHLTLDVDVQDLSLRLGRGLPPLELAQARTRLQADHLADGARFSFSRLSFKTPQGFDWPDSRLALRWRWQGTPPGLLPLADAADAAEAAAVAASGEPAAQSAIAIQAAQPASAAAPASPAWALTGGQIDADRLDLAPLAALAERLPLGAPLRRLLAQLDPVGTVRDLRGEWDGPLDAPAHYQVKARLLGTAIAAAASPTADGIGRPGWRGADLDLEAAETGGSAQLRLNRGALVVPGVFAEAEVPLERFSAQLGWRIAPDVRGVGPPHISLTVANAQFANADARGSLKASWQTGAGTGFGRGRRLPGILQVEGRIDEGLAARVPRYMPLGLPQASRDWARHAVQGGRVQGVDFRVSGDLWAFPFVRQGEGEFNIDGRVQGLALALIPSVPALGQEPAWTSPWPAFTEISGRLQFERNSLRFSETSGRLWGLRLAGVSGGIPEWSAAPVVQASGQVAGPAADLLRFVRSTPINDWTHQVLAQATATADATLELALSVPLAQPELSTVRGHLALLGSDVRLRPDLPLFGSARGPVVFSEQMLRLDGVQARLLGGEAKIRGGTREDGPMRFQVDGTASAQGLRATTEFPLLPTLAQHLQGQAPYRLQLTLGEHQPELVLDSSLQGMAIRLPAPLDKAAAASWPLKVSNAVKVAAGGAVSDRVQVSLAAPVGPLLGQLERAIRPSGVQVQRHAWSLGAPLPAPAPGGAAAIVLDQLDLAAWQALGDEPQPSAPVAGRTVLAASAKTGSANNGTNSSANDPAGAAATTANAGLSGTDWPQTLQLKVKSFSAMGRRLTDLVLDLRRQRGEADRWRAEVMADQVQGSVEYRLPSAAHPAGRISARLSRLALPPAEAEQVVSALDESDRLLPALDLDIGDFRLGDRQLGHLMVEAVNRAPPGESGARHEWQLSRLNLRTPEGTATLDASGSWQPPLGRGVRRLALAFRLQVADAGRLLEQLDLGKALAGGSGELRGTLGWDGSPLAMDLPSLGGGFALQLHQGRFLKADPGGARLLGVLSLQALPRRLLLDFRDLFEEGFAFDNASADVRIANGVAHTNNLRLRGMHAAVLIEGEADIAGETQNLHAIVLPELNTVSASLAYAVINPAVGLGALFGQWILREPLRQAAAREFHITGHWDDPQVERVAREPGAALPSEAALIPRQGAALPASSDAPASAAAAVPADAGSGIGAASPPAMPRPAASGPPR